VSKDAKVCPRCGSFFSSIKCPRCGYVGKADDFALGCPSCGSMEAPNPAPEPMRPLPVAAPPVPWWAFVAAGAVLVGLSILLFSTLR
jgi:RNA polymerase subunit RPABC4/transcription elongation factor Spt4